MKIEVRGKHFDIKTVNMYAHETYDDLQTAISELRLIEVEVMEKRVEYLEAEKSKDKVLARKLNKELKEVVIECNISRKAKKREIWDLEVTVVKEIVTRNGYEYDEDFWLGVIDKDELDDFMLKCVAKDNDRIGKSKPGKKK